MAHAAAGKAATEEKIVQDIPEVIYDKITKKTYNQGKFLGKGGFGLSGVVNSEFISGEHGSRNFHSSGSQS